MEILKNSEKFSVFKAKDKRKKNVVLKIANKKPEKIFKEIRLIKKLCLSSKFFKDSIPGILEYGFFKKGLFKSKGYYKQKYIPGLTFSQIIQKQAISKKKLILILKILLKNFISYIRDVRPIKKKEKSTKYLNNLIFKEYNKIFDKYLFSDLEKSKNIYINGKRYKNIKFYLRKILNSKKVKNLDQNIFFLSNLGHWNFHGGNIIFPNKKNYNKFYIIDPDATWKLNDPFFSLARFIYTYPHDTMEYNKYLIYSDNLKEIKNKKKLSFKIKILWNKNVNKKYTSIFSQFYLDNLNRKNLLKSMLSRQEYVRFNLSLILCFMRGINSNFESKINFFDKKALTFQNKGLYLYLLTLTKLDSFNKFLYLQR